jgi:hypothetical protein
MALTMNVTYADFPVLTPTASNKAVGGVTANGDLYCRSCIERLHMNWGDMKYITRNRTNNYMYNCIECGWRISKKRISKFS